MVKLNICVQDAGNSELSSHKVDDDIPIIDSPESPLNTKFIKIGDEDAQPLDVKKADDVRSCEEALRNLEAAAENALQSLYKIETMNIGEEIPKSVYAKGALMLPSIESKIQAIAKLLQPSSSSLCSE